MQVRVMSVLLAAVVAGCSEEGGGTGTSPATSTSSAPPSSVALSEPKLPAIQSVAKAGGATITASREADWTLVAHGRAWISGLGKGVGVYDARTGRPLGSVAVPQGPCAATDEGFGAVWTATCEPGGVSRIDPATASVTGHLALPMTSDGESSIGVGEGAVWAIIDGSGCRLCAVARIDPKTLKVTSRYLVPGGASAVRAGLGGVWVTNSQTDSVLRLDPPTGKIVASIPVASGGTEALVAQVDPESGRIIRRIGAGEGSGSAGAGSGQLWISAHDVSKLYRVPVQ